MIANLAHMEIIRAEKITNPVAHLEAKQLWVEDGWANQAQEEKAHHSRAGSRSIRRKLRLHGLPQMRKDVEQRWWRSLDGMLQRVPDQGGVLQQPFEIAGEFTAVRQPRWVQLTAGLQIIDGLHGHAQGRL